MAIGDSSTSSTQVFLENLAEFEVVYQRCILVTGKSTGTIEGKDHFISVSTSDALSGNSFPTQKWPMAPESGRFKALLIFSPGQNTLSFEHYQNDRLRGSLRRTILYIPLPQLPPLYLAIMIAKDSPLSLDYPVHNKVTGSYFTHSSLDLAVAKFRVTAYMWQAAIAEDMRAKGLGHRSFRLEEEWGVDTLSREFSIHDDSNSESGGKASQLSSSDTNASTSTLTSALRQTAKVYLIRSDLTTTELQGARLSKQKGNDELNQCFVTALQKHRFPFVSSTRPVVAGLVLDSHYSSSPKIVLVKDETAPSNPKGLSLGSLGSQSTFAWPRFFEEITSCLLDSSLLGDKVARNSKAAGEKYDTVWKVCSKSQSAFLQVLVQAFGLKKVNSPMTKNWVQFFLAHTVKDGDDEEEGEEDKKTANRWSEDAESELFLSLPDALTLKSVPQFRLPGDKILDASTISATPTAYLLKNSDSIQGRSLSLECPAGIARVQFNNKTQSLPSVLQPAAQLQYTLDELEHQFDRQQNLSVDILGMNGKEFSVLNVWKLFEP